MRIHPSAIIRYIHFTTLQPDVFLQPETSSASSEASGRTCELLGFRRCDGLREMPSPGVTVSHGQ